MSGDFFPLKNERTSECLFLPLLVPCPVSIFFKWHWRNSHINRSTVSGNLKAVRVHLCWFMSRLIEKLLYVEDHHFVVLFGNTLRKLYILLRWINLYRNLLIFKDIKYQKCPSKWLNNPEQPEQPEQPMCSLILSYDSSRRWCKQRLWQRKLCYDTNEIILKV